MITVTDKQTCCGCHACMSACPTNAIRMEQDEEGFLYPLVNDDKCLRCGKCQKVCPILAPPSVHPLDDTYACHAADSQEHASSSSGGAFAVIARHILEQGGVVFGAAFDEQLMVHHMAIEKVSQLPRLKGTKYVQSTIGDSYTKAEANLKAGNLVLFSGTPCQVAGLKAYLGMEYENLLTMDLICHGVPSPTIWKRYLNELVPGKRVVDVSFRNKTAGIDAVTLDYTLESGLVIQEKHSESMYMNGFIQNLYIRPSCYDCHFKGTKRCSDLTIGDFWSAKEFHKAMMNPYGVSVVIIHTEKGRKWFERCRDRMIIKPSAVSNAMVWNEHLVQSASQNPNKEKFQIALDSMSVSEAVCNNLIAPPSVRKSNMAKRIIRKVAGLIRQSFR